MIVEAIDTFMYHFFMIVMLILLFIKFRNNDYFRKKCDKNSNR